MSQNARPENDDRNARASRRREFTGNAIDFNDPTIRHNRVLLVGGRRFYVMDQYLATWSDYFEVMFNANFKENGQQEIPIEDVCSADFYDFLAAIYPSRLQLNGDILPHILDLACRFLTTGLIRECERFILTNFAGLDPFDVIELAFKYETHLAASVNEIKNKFTDYCRAQLHSTGFFKKVDRERDRQERQDRHRAAQLADRARAHNSPERPRDRFEIGFVDERAEQQNRGLGFGGGFGGAEHRRRNRRFGENNFEDPEFLVDLEDDFEPPARFVEAPARGFGGDRSWRNAFHDTRGNAYKEAKEACNNSFLAENGERIRNMPMNCQMFIFHAVITTSAPERSQPDRPLRMAEPRQQANASD